MLKYVAFLALVLAFARCKVAVPAAEKFESEHADAPTADVEAIADTADSGPDAPSFDGGTPDAVGDVADTYEIAEDIADAIAAAEVALPDACTPGGCDDANPCTDDNCDQLKGCAHIANSAACSDDNACTTGESCKDGNCASGKGVDCNDGNPCTVDSCALAAGCTHTAGAGNCDDGNPCTQDDACKGGACVPGSPLACPANDACILWKCDPVAAKCKPGYAQAGSACDDGSACTQGDACQNGDCIGKVGSCNDGNPCTDDSCDAQKGCVFSALADNTGCDDGNSCTENDKCTAGKCGGTGKSCDDGNACTTDSCDGAGKCVYAANASPCDDGSVCTTADKCAANKCVSGAALNCDDANSCTDDSCDNLTGCKHVANAAACSDGNVCTAGDVCAAAVCKAGAALDADGDGFPPVSCGGTDCDDNKIGVNPAAKETCATLYDDNCDGNINDINATNCNDFYMDFDGDGFGKLADKQCTCALSGNYKVLLAKATDCADTNAAINPSATELCTPVGIDDNCDGQIDEGCPCPAKPGYALPACSACLDNYVLINTNVGDVCAPDAPVWGIQPISPTTFTDNGDGTVSDSLTKLMWQKGYSANGMDWATAKTFCQTQATAGKNDWRLPTEAELWASVDFTKQSPAVTVAFAGTPSTYFWSAVPWAPGGAGWRLNFDDGQTDGADTSYPFRVRCVR